MDLTPDPSLPVTRVGKYDLLRKLGQGGMAEVFLARRTGIEGFAHLCVVKTILPQYANDPDFVEMFFDEARITVELQHTNIVRVFDLDRDGEFVYLAMEFVDGMDALTLMIECEERGVTVPFGPLLYIISETLRGLLHAHMAADMYGRPLGLIHRDISPGNILLGVNGAVKLSDFGVARASISRRSEEPGMLVGKLRYFSPELLMGADASQQSDIFAVGTCLYEMLAMEPLFPPAETIFQQQLYVRDWSVDALLEQHLNFPDGVDDILRRALAKDPADRYESAQHFLEDCIDLAHESQIRLGDIAMINFIKELRKASLEAPARELAHDQSTRFRDESREGMAGDAELLSGLPSQGGIEPDEEESIWPEEPQRGGDATESLRRALTAFREETAPPSRGPAAADQTAPPSRGPAAADQTAPPSRGPAAADQTAPPSRGPAAQQTPSGFTRGEPTVSDPAVQAPAPPSWDPDATPPPPQRPLSGPLAGGGPPTPGQATVREPTPPPVRPEPEYPTDDRMFQATGIVTPRRPMTPEDTVRASMDPDASVDTPMSIEASLPLVEEEPEPLPRLADVLTSPNLGERKKVPAGPGTTLQFRMAASTMVELFTHRGRLGPYPAQMVQHASEHGRMSGIELISVDSAPWEPLFNFLADASPEQRKRVKAFDFVRLGPLLIHWARKAGRFECMLWSGGAATHLGIAEGRVVTARTYPPLRREEGAASQGLARAMSWPRGGALGIGAPHLKPSSAAPLLTHALIQAVGDTLPPHQLRRMASSRKDFRLQILPEATTAVERVSGFGDRARTLVRRRKLDFQTLSEDDLRDAVKLVALGLAKAVDKR